MPDPVNDGLSEAFVHTLKRDYVPGADPSSAAAVLEQLPRWITDHNGVAPHSALGYAPPPVNRTQRAAAATVELVTG